MASDTTEVKIANLALTHLGMGKINALTDTNPRAEAMNEYFTVARDDVLREHRWSFATAIGTLTNSTVVSTTLHPDWEYYYDYPANCMNVWRVYNCNTLDSKDEQDFEKFLDHTNSTLQIGTDLDDAIAEFSFKVTDPTIFDDKFILALSYRLAGLAAHVLLGDSEKGLALIELSNSIIDNTKRIDSAEKKKKPEQSTGYIDAR